MSEPNKTNLSWFKTSQSVIWFKCRIGVGTDSIHKIRRSSNIHKAWGLQTTARGRAWGLQTTARELPQAGHARYPARHSLFWLHCKIYNVSKSYKIIIRCFWCPWHLPVSTNWICERRGVYPRALRHRYLTRRLVPIRKFARNWKLQYVGMMS
jgi:hypothetical protein